MNAKPFKRSMMAKVHHICYGCLSYEHAVTECHVEVCKLCTSGKKHHKLLCFAYCNREASMQEPRPVVGILKMPVTNSCISTASKPIDELAASSSTIATVKPKRIARTHFSFEAKENPQAEVIQIQNVNGTLLATALIRVRSLNGEYQIARALCDTGAQANLISENCMKLIGGNRNSSCFDIAPVGDADMIKTRGTTQIIIAPLYDEHEPFRIQLKALVMKRISSE